MLVCSAIVPHSPLLVPLIGKEKRGALHATLKAYEELEERLYAAGVETLMIMSPHGPTYPDAFSANVAPIYTGSFKTFGDHETGVKAQSDIKLLDRVQKHMRQQTALPFTLTSSEELDYGSAIPLLLLSTHLRAKIAPIMPCGLDAQTHVEFGKQLRTVLDDDDSRIAFLASADLSHRVNEQSPIGVNLEGPAFDAVIRQKIKTMDIEALLAMDPEAVEAAGQCGYKPIMTLIGLLHGAKVDVKELCYESPFGVGYLTALFDLV